MTEHSALAPAVREIVESLRVDLSSLTVTTPTEVLTADTARDLRQMLSGHLYTEHHIRSSGNSAGSGSSFYRDEAFEQILAHHTPHSRSLATGKVLRPAPDGLVLVDGVRVSVPNDSFVEIEGNHCRLRVPSQRPVLSPGFFLVDGSVGRFPRGDRLLRYYLSIDEKAAAPIVWSRTLAALEEVGFGYRAKIGSSDRTYPRTDAMVVYLSARDPMLAGLNRVDPEEMFVTLVADGLPLAQATSAYTRRIAPGVTTAEEPADPRPGMAAMSFGEHRSYAIATGVLTASSTPLDSVRDALVSARIDPTDPSLNLNDEQ